MFLEAALLENISKNYHFWKTSFQDKTQPCSQDETITSFQQVFYFFFLLC